MLGRWRATTNVKDVLQDIRDAMLTAHPASPAAAETYAGLRQQICDLATHRRRHLVHLARLSAAAPEHLPNLLAELRAEENLTEQWDGPSDWFTTSTPPPSAAPTGDYRFTVHTPAYVVYNDDNKPTVIRRGTGEWTNV